eukprot:CAMPEP_0172459760 /NCGR_PEP_ID=MMETSP1065-20121228/34050_1 /TAXON_ID=265537 /ORGANISM="Amphiprora paludosa, Strain CCMP125" /LENGTH=294 /DNA_ID=CAMNT_0013214579 /DNA_START=55 /DNA_END=936 /DNA_ORIENTATION=-
MTMMKQFQSRTMASSNAAVAFFLLVLGSVSQSSHGWTPHSLSSGRGTTSHTRLGSVVDPSKLDVVPSTFVSSLPPLPRHSRRVILVQSGESRADPQGLLQGARVDEDLTAVGQGQARALQAELQGLQDQVGVLASSHLERSSQTADVLRHVFPNAIRVINHKFGEVNMGADFEGRQVQRSNQKDHDDDDDEDTTWQINRQAWMDFQNNIWLDNPQVPFPQGGESLENLQTRAVTALEQLWKHFPDSQQICIVGHTRFNELLVQHLLGLSPTTTVEQGLACINVLDLEERGASSW